MKELTCRECQNKFQVRYLDMPLQSGFCPKCQLNNDITEAQENIKKLNLKMQSIKPTIQELKQIKDNAAAAYYKAKDNWSSIIKVYEKLDREAAMIQHKLDIKLKKKDINKKAKQRKKAKSPKDAAMEALKALSQEELLNLIKNLQN